MEKEFFIPLGLQTAISNREFLDLLGKTTPRGGNPAAEWRLRIKRQTAIDNRLSELGSLALLSGGSLLVLNDGSSIERLKRSSSWRETLEDSAMYQSLDPLSRGRLKGAKYDAYTRIESSIQSLGQMLCLVYKNLDDPVIVTAFGELKKRCVANAFISDWKNDETVEYIKWLGKTCQASYLGCPIQDPDEQPFVIKEGNSYLPFVGELQFISDIIVAGSRTNSMTHRQALCLSQLGNLPRSLPYPSHDQVKDSISKTLKLVQEKTKTPAKALADYRLGLSLMRDTIPPLKDNSVHLSMQGSGTVENSRAEGGRARYLVAAARRLTDQRISQSHEKLAGKLDQFGKVILNSFALKLALKDAAETGREITLGSLMYLDSHEVAKSLENYFEKGRKIPPKLGDILNLTASMLIRQVGHYEPEPSIIEGIMCFDGDTVFRLDKKIFVKAEVSIEAGLKCRMTTACMAAFAHLGQLPANLMRNYLSQDPFHRVGFEESDKLWEVLKAYRKAGC